jgi:hypothetical protein
VAQACGDAGLSRAFAQSESKQLRYGKKVNSGNFFCTLKQQVAGAKTDLLR